MVYWVDISQAIGAYATAGALIFVGFQTLLTRKQTRLMQEQVGRAWIGTETEGISVNEQEGQLAERYTFVDLVMLCKNYGNVPAKLLNWRSQFYHVDDTNLKLRMKL